MLSKSNMDAVVKAVLKKEGPYYEELLAKEAKNVSKYMPLIQNIFKGTLKEKTFLYATCRVVGLFKKKINYAMLYSKDSFYYCRNEYNDEYIQVKYEDIQSVKRKSIHLTITLKDQTDVKIVSAMAETMSDFLNTIIEKYYPAKEVPTSAEPKKVVTKKSEAKKPEPKKTETKKVETKKPEPEKVEPKKEVVVKEAPAPAPSVPDEKPAPKAAKVSTSTKPEDPRVARLNKLKMEDPDSKLVKVFEFSLLPVLDEIVPVTAGKEDKTEIISEIRSYINGARGLAFYEYRGLTVEQDNYLRRYCKNHNIKYAVYKSTMLKKAMKGTPKEYAIKIVENYSAYACVFFNNIDDILGFKKYTTDNRIDYLLDNVCLGDISVSLNALNEYSVQLQEETTLQNTGIDSSELLSVVIKKNLFAIGKTSDDKLSGYIKETSSERKIKLEGQLPLTIVENVDISVALDLSGIYAKAGYQVDIVDSAQNSIWDRIRGISSKIIDVDEFDTQVQLIYTQKDSAYTNKESENNSEIVKVVLDDYNRSIPVLKYVKDLTGLGLKEAKELCEYAPKTICELENYSEAVKIVDEIIEAGGSAHIENADIGEQITDTKYESDSTSDGYVNVQLLDIGQDKMEIIMLVREYLGLDLRESKHLIESYPCTLKSFSDADKATQFARVLKDAGAKIKVVGLIDPDKVINVDELVLSNLVNVELMDTHGQEDKIKTICNQYLSRSVSVPKRTKDDVSYILVRKLSVNQGKFLVSEIEKLGGQARIVFAGCAILNEYEFINPATSVLNEENINILGQTEDTVNVILTDYGNSKVSVIKVIKEELDLGLKEAKDLVERAPVLIRENISCDDADKLISKLEEAGATAKKT